MESLRFLVVRALLATMLAAPAAAAHATSPVATLVKDINTAGSAASSNPREIAAIGPVIYFAADGGAGQCQLWRTDGTAGGTRSVKLFDSICGPFDSYFKGPMKLTDLNGMLLFFVDDGVSGFELWRSDGTEAGTFLVKDINPGPGSGIPMLDERYETAILNGTLYFVADDGVTGAELWRTDGTEGGTALVKDIYPGLTWSRPSWLTALNGSLYFGADDGVNGSELWRSNGTGAGTVMVKDLNPGGGYAFPQYFTLSNGTIFFVADDEAGGTELWRTNGTAAGTVRVKDINPGPESSIIRNWSVHAPLTDVDGTLFFPARGPADPFGSVETALWKSDGTEVGTVMVKKMACCDVQLNSLSNLDGTLLFEFAQGLWRSDGTEAGTVDIPGAGVRFIHSWTFGPDQAFTVAGGLAYFPGDDGAAGLELWRTDGTAAGTWMVKDINTLAWGWGSNPGMVLYNEIGGYLNHMVHVGGVLYFPAEDPQKGVELWRSDGTEAGTVRVADLNPGLGTSVPLELTDLDGKLVFSADDGINGRELWGSDGTTAGTVLLKDIYPGSDASTPTGFTELNRSLFFLARTSPATMGLWKTDGTARGTVPVKAIDAGWPNSDLLWLTRAGRRLYFRHHDGDAGISSLWTSDGTKGGTVPLTNRAGGPAYPSDLTAVGGALYFVASDRPDSGLADIGLWKSDGTVKGTVLVKKFSVGASLAVPFNLVAFDGNLIFQLDHFDGRPQPTEIWKSDGTRAGTVPVTTATFPAGPQFTAVDGTLFFVAYDGVTGTELWKTNGTAAGTRIVKDIELGGEWYGSNPEYWFAYSSWPAGLTAMGGKLYFYAVANDFVTSLWRSDGTGKGTVKVLSPTAGPVYGSSKSLTAIGRTLLFSDDDGVTGREPWLSDGTRRGTRLLADVAPGAESSNPAGFVVSGSNLFFAADGRTTGRELWAIPWRER